MSNIDQILMSIKDENTKAPAFWEGAARILAGEVEKLRKEVDEAELNALQYAEELVGAKGF